jgi:pimeloyl-ACP methyl ester carboxylesterase
MKRGIEKLPLSRPLTRPRREPQSSSEFLPLKRPRQAGGGGSLETLRSPDPRPRFRERNSQIRRFDLVKELARIRCPTLILSGELDPIVTVRDQEELAKAIPESRLAVFAGAGHGVWRDKPNEALAAIREFVCAPAL